MLLAIWAGLRKIDVRPLRQITKPPKSRLAVEVTLGFEVGLLTALVPAPITNPAPGVVHIPSALNS